MSHDGQRNERIDEIPSAKANTKFPFQNEMFHSVLDSEFIILVIQ